MAGITMIDVSAKPVTSRTAEAIAIVELAETTAERIRRVEIAKGDVMAMLQVAAILGIKNTSAVLPLCHPLAIEASATQAEFIDADRVQGFTGLGVDPTNAYLLVRTSATIAARTGVEMEALLGASSAALCVYDMCKSIDRGARVLCVQLQKKAGGKSGDFTREEPDSA